MGGITAKSMVILLASEKLCRRWKGDRRRFETLTRTVQAPFKSVLEQALNSAAEAHARKSVAMAKSFIFKV